MREKTHVFAMNISQPNYGGLYFEWYCPVCDELHWTTEYGMHLSALDHLSIALKCSDTVVHMPGVVKKSPRSIYGC